MSSINNLLITTQMEPPNPTHENPAVENLMKTVIDISHEYRNLKSQLGLSMQQNEAVIVTNQEEMINQLQSIVPYIKILSRLSTVII